MTEPPHPKISTTTTHARRSRRLVLLGLLALAAYGVFLGINASVVAGGADQSGYLNSARLLAEGRLQSELRVPAEFGPHSALPRHHFMPLGFDVRPHNPNLAPTYPVGVPLHLAVAGKLFGWTAAPLIVELATALAALGLCFAVARRLGIDAALAAAGAVVLAAFPVFLFTSVQPLSDTPAATWCLATVWLALRSRDHAGWAVACGAAFAMAVFVRATNAVLLPALLVLIGADGRRLALAMLGGLPGAGWLAYYNHTLYGGALRSGYGAIEQTFALAYGPPTFVHFAYWLAVLTPAVLLFLPVVAWWRTRSRELLALLLWFGAITGLYVFYEVSRETWWCLRFILPAFPALVLAALLGVQALLRRGRTIAAVALALWAVAGAVYWTPRLPALGSKAHESVYLEASRKAKEVVPADALVAAFYASGALYYYTDFPVLRWDLIEPDDFNRYATLARAAGRPVYAVLLDNHEDEARSRRMPGNWIRVADVERAGIWRLESWGGSEAQP